jgi:hypothetical protein
LVLFVLFVVESSKTHPRARLMSELTTKHTKATKGPALAGALLGVLGELGG